MRRSKWHLYPITSSVRASSIGERSTPECLRSLEIDDQLKFVRKFDRQVTRLGTFEDLHDVGSRATKVISEIDAIADQTASIDMFAKAIDGWQRRTRGELGDAFPLRACRLQAR
jgi:hypothetical protein